MSIADAPPSVDEAASAETPIRQWKTCLHEAGHVVAGRHLLKRATGAAVFGNGTGVANLGSGTDVPVSFREAMAAAAGKAAESLADQYAPPEVPLPVPLEIAYPETAGPLAARVAKLMPDETAIARWCIQRREGEPRLWSRRHRWVYSAAAEFVAEYQQEIVNAAAELYEHGIVTLPVEFAALAPPAADEK